MQAPFDIVQSRTENTNSKSAAITRPHSAFLDQAHIRTICTIGRSSSHNLSDLVMGAEGAVLDWGRPRW